jgi:2-polyprenyl-3-methyl-5-hydroxy-6-metoxy-1,4-benzoquinol methylase
MSRVHYTFCPVCNSNRIHPLMQVKDYSVSGETFAIWQCEACSLRFTQDVPDENEISRYYKSDDYISHTNTNRGIVNQLYLQVRNITLRLKSGTIKKHTARTTGAVLDIGAGTGAFLKHMQAEGWAVTGIEPDSGARQVAWQTFGLDLQPFDRLRQLPKESFDAITLWHVLEHVHNLHDYMGFLKSLLKPGGKLFIAVPNYTSADAAIYRLAWAAYDVPRHLYHFSPQTIQVLMERHGLRVLFQKPMWFDAFYISLLSSKYKNGTPSWMGALSSGLRSNMTALLSKKRCSSLLYIISA